MVNLLRNLFVKRILPGVLFLLILVPGAQTAPDIFFYFDEYQDSARAVDDGGSGFDLPYLGESAQTNEAAKFGEGSLALGPGPVMGVGGGWLHGSISRMTITLWIKPRDEREGSNQVFLVQRLVRSSIPGQFTFGTHFGSDGLRTLHFYLGRGEGEVMAKIHSEEMHAWSPDGWIHLAMTYDNGKIVFYVNGEMLGFPQLLPEEEIVEMFEDASSTLRTMVSSPGVEYMDDFGFFGDAALSEEQIREIYENGLKAFVESGQLRQATPAP